MFKSTEYIFSEVKRFLKTYNSANLIDEGEFPTYVKDVLGKLGQSVRKESQFVTKVDCNKVIDLPDDYDSPISAYRCKESGYKRTNRAIEQKGAIIYNDITRDIIYSDTKCDISCLQNSANILERITIKQMVEDSDYIVNFSYPQPLHINRQGDGFFTPGQFQSGTNEVYIEDKKLHVNFDEDWIYLKYYAFPIDEYGVPMIPDIESVEKAIKWYIIYQISLSWWWNTEVPDIQNKWQQAEQEYKTAFAEASYETKLWGFGDMIESARRKRKYSQQAFFTKNMYN